MQLYKQEKFQAWSFNRVIETLCNEWADLEPSFEKNILSYGKKTDQIIFKGDVNVTLEPQRQRYPEKDLVQMYFGFSLSPKPYNLETHVLNTFDMADFVGLFPNLSGKHFFTIPKQELWNDSLFSTTANAMHSLLKVMLTFESCFRLLLNDKYKIDKNLLDARSLSISHHLNQVKAYRLAEIYGHPEKLEEAVDAIKRFALSDELTMERLEAFRSQKPHETANWLYSEELLKKLRA